MSALDTLLDIPPHPCVVCDRPSRYGAIFEPADSSQYGAPTGKKRFIRYDLCPRCYRRPDVTDLVEGIVLGRVRKVS